MFGRTGSDSIVLVFAVLAFVAVVLLLDGLRQTWLARYSADARRIRERLGGDGPVRGADARALMRDLDVDSALERRLASTTLGQAMRARIGLSGLKLSLLGFAGVTLAIAAVTWLAMSAVLNLPLLVALVTALVVGALPAIVVHARAAARIQRYEKQLPDALDLLTRALRAGHSFNLAMQTAGEELPDPLAAEFRLTVDETKFGVSMSDALTSLAARVPSVDFRFFVIAVLIQRETGGNLGELLSNLARLMRQRQELVGRVAVLTAEGRMSGWVLSLLPVVLGLLLTLINPKLMSLLWTDPAGRAAVGAAITLVLVGALWMRMLVRIKP